MPLTPASLQKQVSERLPGRGCPWRGDCVSIEGFTSDRDVKGGGNFLPHGHRKMHFASCETLVTASSSHIILLFSIAACQSQVMVSWDQEGGRYWGQLKKKVTPCHQHVAQQLGQENNCLCDEAVEDKQNLLSETHRGEWSTVAWPSRKMYFHFNKGWMSAFFPLQIFKSNEFS